MMKLLEQAFSEPASLPADEQDALARWLLDELKFERCWSDLFHGSQGLLAKLAREPLEEHRHGRTQELDDRFSIA